MALLLGNESMAQTEKEIIKKHEKNRRIFEEIIRIYDTIIPNWERGNILSRRVLVTIAKTISFKISEDKLDE